MRFVAALLLSLFLGACATYNVKFDEGMALTKAALKSEAYQSVVQTEAVDDPHRLLGGCSAVVLAPGVAITAAHCQEDKMQIVRDDSVYTIRAIDEVPNRDLIYLHVNDLECPCAEVALTPAKEGEDAVAIGYGGLQFGALVTAGYIVGRSMFEVFDPAVGEVIMDKEVLVSTTHIEHGNSGGGLFVYRDGAFYLVGVPVMGPGSGIPALSEEIKRGEL